jgi:hypothetical protein
MIIRKKLIEVLPMLSQLPDELTTNIVERLNAESPALTFEMELHKLLEKSLPNGLSILEAVGALECVKMHLQNDFYHNMSKPTLQVFNENAHGIN